MSVTARPWLRPEPHSVSMPAWKREVLERKRAKKQGVPAAAPVPWSRDGSPHRRRSDRGRSSGRKSSPGAGKAVRAPSPAAAKAVRAPTSAATVKGVRAPSPAATVKGVRAPSPVKSARSPSPAAVKPGRTSSPVAAKPVMALGSAKPAPVKRRSDDGERLVLQESLGPLHENPFIRLEQERRRKQPREPSPAPTLLEMYSNVPGIRTIRAENIIIIESDPGYFSGTKKQEPHADPVEALLAKSGSKVTAIRASEVVIYETQEPGPQNVEKESSEVQEEAGRVSRLLEKFGHGHGRPPRSRSWDDILDRRSSPSRDDSDKMPALPKQTAPQRHSQATVNKAPKRYGEISPSSNSFSEEESKRFPLNDPSWLPSKPVLTSSALLYKKPSSPTSSPVTSPGLSPFPLSSHNDTDEKVVSPSVATFRERFEAGSTADNLPLPKPLNATKKSGNNTFIVYPKAASYTKAKPSETVGVQPSDAPVLTNGYVDHPDGNPKPKAQVSVQDLLSKTKYNRTSSAERASEEHRKVPSASVSANHISKVDNSRRPKSEADIFNSNSPLKSSATQSETTLADQFKPTLASATPNQQNKVSSSTSSNSSFEIRPAVITDPSSIPEGDIQAKALANIRMQSRNSFVFIPKKSNPPVSKEDRHEVQKSSKEKPKVNAPTTNGPKLDYRDFPRDNGILSNGLPPSQTLQENTGNDIDRIQLEVNGGTQKACSVPSLSDFDWQSGLLPSHSSTEGHSFTDKGAELEYLSSVHQNNKVAHIQDNVHLTPDIPITNIDDIVNSDVTDGGVQANITVNGNDSPLPSYRPHTPLSSSVHNKSGNTFTVVPKRKPITEQEPLPRPVLEEDEDVSSKRKSLDGIETPYSEIGAMLKKRYPTADEIQVVGGYQSLSKSCLSKNGSTRKKMKITFNEQNIHKVFEYPSENSLTEDTGEEDGNEASGSECEEEEPSERFFPRAKFGSASHNANSGLSDYTLKHTEYGSGAPQHGKAPGEDTLSLDESSKLALYF
ncbi:taperin isoform X2 [Xenopus tropicalis]|uniref:Taperin n=1 Tax=Xenopus tropicalis TaxID=8364 RepID=A0A6I8QKE4_XENTR|nr:taperin isoform X2 [Xenopus tropicalis]